MDSFRFLVKAEAASAKYLEVHHSSPLHYMNAQVRIQ